jgi:hypothetical protein
MFPEKAEKEFCCWKCQFALNCSHAKRPKCFEEVG